MSKKSRISFEIKIKYVQNFLGDASGRRIKERYLYLSGSSECCGQKD